LGWSPFLHPDWEASCTKSDPRASQTDAAGIVCEHASRIDPNVITISIQPGEGISIAFDAKRPGTQVRTVTVQANFSYQASFGSKGPVAYETLLLDSMRGDATLLRAETKYRRSGKLLLRLKKHGRSYRRETSQTMRRAPTGQPRGLNCSRSVVIVPNTRSTTAISGRACNSAHTSLRSSACLLPVDATRRQSCHSRKSSNPPAFGDT